MKSLIPILLVGVLAFLGGCSTSPVSQSGGYPGAGETAVLAASTAAGAAVGNSIDGKIGSPAGAALGLGVGILANKYFTDKERSAFAEGYAQGQRDARAKLLNQYWEERTQRTQQRSPTGNAQRQAGEGTEVSYTRGIVDGVRYEERADSQPTIHEPVR